MMKVLFLSAWYPNKFDAMFGLFVRKHAEAVSLYSDVTVLYLHADKHIKHFEIVHQCINDNAREIIIYYPEKTKGFLRKIFKSINYFRANYIGYKEVKKLSGKPDIAHVNVLSRTGVLAYLLKKTKGIPYVITEHWTRYLFSRQSFNGFFRKLITKTIVKNASVVMPVSEDLKAAMLSHKLYNLNYQVVNNVVEDVFFNEHPSNDNKTNKKTILHISCFDDDHKNVTGILRVVSKLSKIRDDFQMVLIGTGADYNTIFDYSKQLSIPTQFVRFTGELMPDKVAHELFASDFFVLFSNHENAPVVISESLSCGKPVISSNVGGIAEMINEVNGILIAARDEKALLESITYMLDHYPTYDVQRIREEAKTKYSYESVGLEIHKIYTKILTNNL